MMYESTQSFGAISTATNISTIHLHNTLTKNQQANTEEWTTVLPRRPRKPRDLVAKASSHSGAEALPLPEVQPPLEHQTSPEELPSSELHPNYAYTATSDEGIKKELDDRNLPYRAGWPRLPPLPLLTTYDMATIWIHDTNTMVKEVGSILDDHEVLWQTIGLAFRRLYDVATQRHGIDTHHALLIGAAKFGPRLEAAIVRLRQMLLKDPCLRHTFIEVIDHRVVGELRTYVVESGHHFLQRQESIRKIVIDEISKRNQTYTNIEFVRRGVNGFEDRLRCPCTVLITTSTADEEVWWKVIVPSIKRRIVDIVRDTAVEVLQGAKDVIDVD